MNNFNGKNVEDKLFLLALKNGQLIDFLCEVGPYKLSSGYIMGPEVIINTGAIMDKIYSYYAVTSDNMVITELQKALETLASYKSFMATYVVLDIEKLQLSREKDGTALFELDHSKILSLLSQNLNNNKAFYSSAGELGHMVLNSGMLDLISSFDEQFSKDFGKKIM